ncbi:protease HtpX (plasmid) [Oscillatoria nigro-viridis PCC 7112]|uniref:Protease HtpX n=1 Tax=Phormidium nigroviride PCC 7112 TaxID=179408 RepID=K9VTW7_9CYAN|nr:protease HtpX [Oscillatoria nigro-viridis PCC 7112]
MLLPPRKKRVNPALSPELTQVIDGYIIFFGMTYLSVFVEEGMWLYFGYLNKHKHAKSDSKKQAVNKKALGSTGLLTLLCYFK